MARLAGEEGGWIERAEARGGRLACDCWELHLHRQSPRCGRARDGARRLGHGLEFSTALDHRTGRKNGLHLPCGVERRQKGSISRATGPGGPGAVFPGFDFPSGFSLADRPTLEVHILDDTIRCILDGREVANIKSDKIDTTIGRTLFVSEPGALIEKLEYRELSGGAAASGEKWNDSLAEFWAKNPTTGGDYWSREAGGLRFGKIASVRAWAVRGGEIADVALRATVSGSNYLNLTLRSDSGNRRYRAGYIPGGAFILIDTGPGQNEELKSVPQPVGFIETDRHTAEFRAQGDTLTLFLDDQEIIHVHDMRITTGDGYIFTNPGTLIEKLEYRVLGEGVP